jgi:DNA-binding response OmpR family regulator
MKDSSLRSGGKSTRALKSRYKIILVDDETDIAYVLKRGLEVKGFDVDAFDSPQEAINSFKPNLYDFAILDIRMPGLNGFTLYRKMKKIDPSLTACFLSAFEMHPDEFKKVFPSMAESVKTIIKKPVSIEVLIKEISPFLRMLTVNKSAYGDHMFVVLETKTEIIDTAFEFLRTGLIENNEDIIFVTSQIAKQEIHRRMSAEWHVDVESLEAEGRINLYTFEEWHFKDNIFNIERNKARFREILERSRKRGAKGVRSVGDMTPFFELEMLKELMAWESAINRDLDLPVRIMCGYTKDNVSQLALAANLTLRGNHSKVVEPKWH